MKRILGRIAGDKISTSLARTKLPTAGMLLWWAVLIHIYTGWRWRRGLLYVEGRGDAWHLGQLSYVLSPKELIQNYQSSIIADIFSSVINRTHNTNFSPTTWEILQQPRSYTWLLLFGASQSRAMPS